LLKYSEDGIGQFARNLFEESRAYSKLLVLSKGLGNIPENLSVLRWEGFEDSLPQCTEELSAKLEMVIAMMSISSDSNYLLERRIMKRC
uniref:Disease resistance protein n=1 Tax=Anisakis simplex TaxID=6269 RepID=A0A0M3JDN8_ANISI